MVMMRAAVMVSVEVRVMVWGTVNVVVKILVKVL